MTDTVNWTLQDVDVRNRSITKGNYSDAEKGLAAKGLPGRCDQRVDRWFQTTAIQPAASFAALALRAFSGPGGTHDRYRPSFYAQQSP
jgi:hypothetical protein